MGCYCGPICLNDCDEEEPDFEIGTCMAGHYGRLGAVCVQRNPETGRMEECGEFV